MKKQQFLGIAFLFLISTFLFNKAEAQQRHANSQQQKSSQSYSSPSSQAKFRLLANVDYSKIDPSALNTHRSQFLWNTTTAAQGSFANLMGFSVGAGYKIGPGFLGIEFNHGNEDLSSTIISPTTNSVKDTVEFEGLCLVYDWIFTSTADTSYEIGLGAGAALKFRFHNVLTSGSVMEDLYWEDTPFVFKLRGSYNYHFSDNVRLKLGLGYEGVSSSNMKADSNHPSITINGAPVVSGQILHSTVTNEDIKVDLSGFTVTAGIVVAF